MHPPTRVFHPIDSENIPTTFTFHLLCSWCLFRWFANLTKFWILKYEYFFSSSKPVWSWKGESLIGQHFFVGPIRDSFSKLKKQIFIVQILKFHQISRSPDDIICTIWFATLHCWNFRMNYVIIENKSNTNFKIFFTQLCTANWTNCLVH